MKNLNAFISAISLGDGKPIPIIVVETINDDDEELLCSIKDNYFPTGIIGLTATDWNSILNTNEILEVKDHENGMFTIKISKRRFERDVWCFAIETTRAMNMLNALFHFSQILPTYWH